MLTVLVEWSDCLCLNSQSKYRKMLWKWEKLSHIMTKGTTWHMRPAKTLISLGICPVWSGSSLAAWRKLGSLATHWVHSKDTDQTGRSLRWAHSHFVGFVTRGLILAWKNCCNYSKVWTVWFYHGVIYLTQMQTERHGTQWRHSSDCSFRTSLISVYTVCPDINIWAATWQSQQSDCAPSEDQISMNIPQSDQSLRCALNGYLRTQGFFMWTAKTLIRLGGCPDWSESSLGAVTLLVLSCGGSFVWILRKTKAEDKRW